MNTKRITIIGLLLIAIGVTFALWPTEWVEESFGFEPDGGNGLLEFLFALIPIVVGSVLVAVAMVRRSDPQRLTLAIEHDAGAEGDPSRDSDG